MSNPLIRRPPVPPPSLVNVANGLTVLRIGLVPVFVVLMIASGMAAPGYRIAAALSFLIASLTDFADGWIARSFNQVTSFGKVADPIADKALTGSALVLLSWYGALPWWVTAVVAVREVGVTWLRFWVIRSVRRQRGSTAAAADGLAPPANVDGVIPASRGGKAKTVLQILAITWYIWPMPEALARVGPWLMAVAVVVTVVTGVDYVVRALRLRRASLAR